jgi:hypothetical protein
MVRTINGVVPIEDALDGHEHGSRRRDCIGAHAILSFAETDKASRRSRRAKVVNDRKAIRRAVTVKNLWAGRAKGLEEHMPEEAEAIVGKRMAQARGQMMTTNPLIRDALTEANGYMAMVTLFKQHPWTRAR